MPLMLGPEEVNSPETLARYCQEQTGIPYPTGAQIAGLRKTVKGFFAEYPDATYITLTNLVQWSKIKSRRYAHVANLISGGLRYAYLDGYLPELNPRTKRGNIDELIDEALRQEQDPERRNALMAPWTQAAKEAAYQEWKRIKV